MAFIASRHVNRGIVISESMIVEPEEAVSRRYYAEKEMWTKGRVDTGAGIGTRIRKG
ncbi:hypothetical protein SCHPADRAFT_909068 [Schizopora paradoxa]|uniref:Uncharacterized protein n=1 Tax=Schizopora paradoxa TaxID=27342 RepID=A0A0H2R950_9AGAM|nr:hypothetical protein SCHPADRAFT_909068 [Schizopora paradoxa]